MEVDFVDSSPVTVLSNEDLLLLCSARLVEVPDHDCSIGGSCGNHLDNKMMNDIRCVTMVASS